MKPKIREAVERVLCTLVDYVAAHELSTEELDTQINEAMSCIDETLSANKAELPELEK